MDQARDKAVKAQLMLSEERKVLVEGPRVSLVNISKDQLNQNLVMTNSLPLNIIIHRIYKVSFPSYNMVDLSMAIVNYQRV